MASKPKIFIAEDDLEDQLIMNQTFTQLGYTDSIQFAGDGAALLELLLTTEIKDIGLIVLDLNMPRLNGTETLRTIKNNPDYSHIPVIIYSTSVNEIERRHCIDLGAVEYITKPSQYMEYLETCKKFYSLSLEAF